MATRPFYDSANHNIPALEEIREVSRYKYLLIQLIRRDILARYKRSILGVAWTMLNPLGMMIIMSVVFSQVFKSVVSYPSYVLSGLVAWTFFSQSTTAAMTGLVWGGSLIQRIYIPRTAFGVSAIGTALVNLLISIVLLLAVMLVSRVAISWTVVFIPISIILLACFALGMGLLLSTMAVYFPDVAEMYHIILLAWMYLTPIIYPEDVLPAKLHLILQLNPMYYLVRLFRIPLLDGRIPTPAEILPAAACGLIMLVVGWTFFTSKADEIAYRV